MKCFYAPKPERRENDVQVRKSLWRRSSWSIASTLEGTGSDITSQTMSDTSFGSPGPLLLQSTSQRPHDLRVFRYAELKTATGNFFRGNLLGEGGFGCVYKGHIKHKKFDEREVKMEVAVKQLNLKGSQVTPSNKNLWHRSWMIQVTSSCMNSWHRPWIGPMSRGLVRGVDPANVSWVKMEEHFREFLKSHIIIQLWKTMHKD